MAISFANAKGSAVKGKMDQFEYKDGDNSVRLVGDVMARYVYWVKGENNKDIPLECLAFDRAEERFTNSEKDYVKDYYPDLKCSWAYAMQCIDGGKVKIINLKKKLFQQIIENARDLGDPTDPDEGWVVYFKKEKTGPRPINVEYTLQVAKCMKNKAPMTAEERELLSELKSMDELMPRPTPAAQKELLDRIKSGASAPESVGEEIDEEFNIS